MIYKTDIIPSYSLKLTRFLAPDIPRLVAHRERDGELIAGAHHVARPAEVGASVDLSRGFLQLGRSTLNPELRQ